MTSWLTNLAQITCYACKVSFWIEEGHHARLRADTTQHFYCPNGHRQHYVTSEADKLRRERDLLAQRIAEKDDALTLQRNRIARVEKRLSATKGVITRIKRRVGNGICPCCNRSFENLARHMQHQHPAFKADAAE